MKDITIHTPLTVVQILRAAHALYPPRQPTSHAPYHAHLAPAGSDPVLQYIPDKQARLAWHLPYRQHHQSTFADDAVLTKTQTQL